MLVCLAAALLGGSPTHAAGFGIFEQGTRAMGMAMAFAAQADDPSAMFYNAGGLGFFEKRAFYAGTTAIGLGDSQFQGALPFPGPTATGDQRDQVLFPPHFYWVEPLTERVIFGLGLESPFGLVTEWDDPDGWAGRFISEKGELRSLDLNPSLGFRAGDRVGIGIGLVVRFSDVELRRRAAAINPFTFTAEEVAKVVLESDFDTGVGANFGILHRVNDAFSWGLAYRSRIAIDYGGIARLSQVPTGDPVFDALVAGSLPFDQDLPIETTIEFPDQASLGLAFWLVPDVVFEADINWTGWSSFDRLEIVFPSEPSLDSTIDADWSNAYNFRTGVRWDLDERSQWRFGLYFDETPQPDKSVGPLLPDADRIGYTVGYGRTGARARFDVALLFVDFRERTTTVNSDGFNGTYGQDALLLGLSLGW